MKYHPNPLESMTGWGSCISYLNTTKLSTTELPRITYYSSQTSTGRFNQRLWKKQKSKYRIYSLDCCKIWTDIAKKDEKYLSIDVGKEELIDFLLIIGKRIRIMHECSWIGNGNDCNQSISELFLLYKFFEKKKRFEIPWLLVSSTAHFSINYKLQ